MSLFNYGGCDTRNTIPLKLNVTRDIGYIAYKKTLTREVPSLKKKSLNAIKCKYASNFVDGWAYNVPGHIGVIYGTEQIPELTRPGLGRILENAYTTDLTTSILNHRIYFDYSKS